MKLVRVPNFHRSGDSATNQATLAALLFEQTTGNFLPVADVDFVGTVRAIKASPISKQELS